MDPGDTVLVPPVVSVVIPSYNGWSHLHSCLPPLLAQTHETTEVIVVDDGSTDGTRQLVSSQFPGVRLISLPHNSGFCVAANAGIAAATGAYIALLNNDTVVQTGWLASLVSHMADHATTGACASKVVQWDRTEILESAGDEYRPWRTPRARGAGHSANDFGTTETVFGASASSAMYRRQALEMVGTFDEDLGSYFEDIDLSLRLQLNGWDVCYIPTAVVRHRSHGTTSAHHALSMTLRNDPLVFVKNMPTTLLWFFMPAMIARQLYQLTLYSVQGRARLCWRAKVNAGRQVVRFWRKRASIRRLTRISSWTLLRILLRR